MNSKSPRIIKKFRRSNNPDGSTTETFETRKVTTSRSIHTSNLPTSPNYRPERNSRTSRLVSSKIVDGRSVTPVKRKVTFGTSAVKTTKEVDMQQIQKRAFEQRTSGTRVSNSRTGMILDFINYLELNFLDLEFLPFKFFLIDDLENNYLKNM